MKPHQYIQHHNQQLRFKLAGVFAWTSWILTPTIKGTIYSTHWVWDNVA